MKQLIGKNSVIAVAGVSLDPRKFGYKVFFDLLNKGYQAFAVHPDGGLADGRIRYPSVRDLPQKPDLLVLVTPPQASEKIILEAVGVGINQVWFQPGSENQEAIRLCEENRIGYRAKSCIMLKNMAD